MEPTASHPDGSAAEPPASNRPIAGPVVALFFGPLGQIAIGHWRRACGWYAAEVGLAAASFTGAWLGLPKLLWLGILATLLLRIAIVVDVVRLDRIFPLPRARILLIVGLGVAIFYDILGMRVRTSFVEAFEIPSGSMSPTLEPGDHMFVKKTSRPFERGDVVVFRFPQDPTIDYVKRIVGVGGDVVSIRDGLLTINGRPVERQLLDEPCATEPTQGGCTLWQESLDGRRWRVARDEKVWSHDFEATTVPVGQYFVLGDNRDNSSDSRTWGPVSADLIKGKPLFIWWSWNDAHQIRWDRINRPVP